MRVWLTVRDWAVWWVSSSPSEWRCGGPEARPGDGSAWFAVRKSQGVLKNPSAATFWRQCFSLGLPLGTVASEAA